jgi:hypothetical protein
MKPDPHPIAVPICVPPEILEVMKALAADSPLRCLKQLTHQLILSGREFDEIFKDDGDEDSASDDDEIYIDTEYGDDDSALVDLDGDRMAFEQ